MNNQLKGEIIMNQDFIEGQTDLELVEVDSIVDSLSTWIEQGAEDIVTFFSSDEVSDILDEISGKVL